MSRTGLKKMLVAGVAIFGLSLCAAQANAGWWWGAAPACYGGWDCCGAAPMSVLWLLFRMVRLRLSPPGLSLGLRLRLRGLAAATLAALPVSCCGTSVAYWGTPVVSSCGCGTVVAPAVAPAEAAVACRRRPPRRRRPLLRPGPTTAADARATPLRRPRPRSLRRSGRKPAAAAGWHSGSTTPVLPDRRHHVRRCQASTSIEPTAGDSGILTVWVPNEAKVTINGLLTKSTGSKRHFVSYGLRPGYTYKYEVKAEVVREGKIVTEEQTVSLTAGEHGGVAFGFNIPARGPGPERVIGLAGLSTPQVRSRTSRSAGPASFCARRLPAMCRRETVLLPMTNASADLPSHVFWREAVLSVTTERRTSHFRCSFLPIVR